jgi:hypothetical protein
VGPRAGTVWKLWRREKFIIMKLLVVKSERNIPHSRPRLKLEDNIKMYLKKVRCMDWIRLTEDRVQ